MSADEIFEKLGYRKGLHTTKKELEVWGEYWENEEKCAKISFDYIDKEICVGTNYRLSITLEHEPLYFNIQELQAINKKCQELGWLEEV